MRHRMPTSQDVAKRAGVSQSTVSYALTGTRPISEKTRQRIEAAIEELGYHPNSGARTLRSRRSGVIGLMVPGQHTSDGGPMPFINVISQQARTFDLDVLLVTSDEGAAGIRRVVGTGLCDALILMEIDRQDERLEAVHDSGLPCVSIGKPDIVPGASVVDLDFERLGHMVVERTRDDGFERLLLYGQLDQKRHRNDVSRFLRGIDEAVRSETSLAVELADGSPSDVASYLAAQTGTRSEIAIFGLSEVLEMLFALAVTQQLGRSDRLFIAMSDHDFGRISNSLSGVPRLSRRQADVSALAVRELVRVMREPSAPPRTTLLPPEWVSSTTS